MKFALPITSDKRDNNTVIGNQTSVQGNIGFNHPLIMPMVGIIVLSTFVIGYMIGAQNLKKY